jgi:hypothetical protein
MSSPLIATIGAAKNAKKTSSREGLRSSRPVGGNDDSDITSEPKESSHHGGEYTGDTLDDLLEEEDGSICWTYVLYPASQADLWHQIVAQIHHMIKSDPAFSADCISLVEFDTPVPNNPALHRVYAAFAREEHLTIFQSKKAIEILVDGVKNIFQISHPGIDGGKNSESGVIRVQLKELPKSLGPVGFLRALDSKRFGTSRPLVKQASNARFMTQKGGVVPRAMLVADVVPQNNDLDCNELLPIVRIPIGKGANLLRVVTLILGCSKHKCAICLKEGHLAKVHEKFADRSTGGKRKASGNLDKLMHSAKRREVAPLSTLLVGVLEDPFTEFVEGKGLNLEAWRCNICEENPGGPAFGLSYTGAIAHIASEGHMEKLAKGDISSALSEFSLRFRNLHLSLKTT